MFAVVVFLVEPRAHCIVPEEYIHGLDEIADEIKTWGANKQHDHLIYWTRSLLDDIAVPCPIIEPPNHQLELSTVYPPVGIDETCYVGRIKRFFSEFFLNLYFKYNMNLNKSDFLLSESFDAAKEYRNKFRPTVTPVFDPDRLNLHSIPPSVAKVVRDGNAELADDSLGAVGGVREYFQNYQYFEDEPEQKVVIVSQQMDQLDINAFDALVLDVINDAVSDENNENSVGMIGELSRGLVENVGNNENNGGSNVSDIEISAEQLAETYENSVLVEQNDPLELPTNEPVIDNPAPEIAAIAEIKITEKIDDDIEITYTLGQRIRPTISTFEVKMNDILSANLPFIEVCNSKKYYFDHLKKQIFSIGCKKSFILDAS